MINSGLYLHIPFCSRRCGYCDFNTFAGQSQLMPQYVDALCQELEIVGGRHEGQKTIDSVFLGGGTPTMLSTRQFARIMEQIRACFQLEPECEITLEANPGTVTARALNELHGMGFTRISFGMQSAHPQDLRILDRQHQFADVVKAVKWSRQAGFDHINSDLIFGIPGQTLDRWKRNLELAVQLGVDHLSLYSLILEEGTPLHRWYLHGLLDLLDDDLIADMYELAIDFLMERGFRQYEISNWAKTREDDLDARCRHNLNTWRYHPYFGVGAGAHGFIGNIRTANVNLIPLYLSRMAEGNGDWPAAETVSKLSQWEQMQEWMMVGLRLVDEGVSKLDFETRFGYSMDRIFKPQLAKLFHLDLLENHPKHEQRIRLTKRGIFLGNRVFGEFVGNDPPDFL